MSRDALRRASWVGAALGSGVGALLSLLSLSVGAAVLGGALFALTCATFLSFQAAIAQLMQLQSLATAAGGPPPKRVLRAVNETRRDVTSRVTALGKMIDAQPYLNAELVRRYQLLIPSDQPMPTLGANWAATPPTILFIIDQILGDDGVVSILECGSGASTVWAASAFRVRGRGHVYTLDHDAVFAEKTRNDLRTHGLSQYATVIDAPLVKVTVPGRGPMLWYDLSGLPDEAQDIDLLFVDGPPRPTGVWARYPALHLLRSRLRDGARVILDDTNRRDEREIHQSWLREPGVRPYRQVGRSAVVQVHQEA